MKRILPAFVAAVLIHAVLLTGDTRWLIRHEPIEPRMRVTTMRLVDREPASPMAIRPLPSSPPPLPPVPEKPAYHKPSAHKPVLKKTRIPKKKAPEKIIRTRTPLASPPALSAPEPAPSKAIAPLKEKIVSQDSGPDQTPGKSISPATPRVSDQTAGEKTAAPAAIVMATPRYSLNPPPVYPSMARKRKHQGTVVLEVLVNADGRVGDLRILESSTHKLLDRAAMKAVRRWRFDPGRRGDHSMAMWVRVPVKFRLK